MIVSDLNSNGFCFIFCVAFPHEIKLETSVNIVLAVLTQYVSY